MQKGGGVIIKPSEAKQDIFTLLNNSDITIFSYKTHGGIILKLELNSEIASPYMSVNPESLGQDVKIIFIKLVFIGNSDFNIYKDNRMIISLNQASKSDFEKEVKIQNDIYIKTQGVNLSPLCPAVLDSYHLDTDKECQKLLYDCKPKLTTQAEKDLFQLIINNFVRSNFTIGLQVMEYIENSKTLASYIYDEQIDNELTKDLYTLAFFKLKTLHSLGYRHNDLHSSNVLVKKTDNCVCSIGKSCCCFDGYDVLIIDFGKTTESRLKPEDFDNSINSETRGFDLIDQLIQNFSTYFLRSEEVEKCIKNKVKEFILNTPNVKKIYEDMGLKEQYKKIIIDAIREMYPGSEITEQWVNNNNDKPLKELLSEIDKSFITYLSKISGFNELIAKNVLKITEDEEKGVKFDFLISVKILQLYQYLNRTEYNEDITKTLFELLQIPNITIEQAKEILHFQVKEILQLHKETNVSVEIIIELYKIPTISFGEKKIIAKLHKETDVPVETIVNIMKIPNATIDITRQLLQLHKETQVPVETIFNEIVYVLNFFNSIPFNITVLNAIDLVKLIEYFKTFAITLNPKQAFVIIILATMTKIDPTVIYKYLITYNITYNANVDHFETAKKYYTGEDNAQIQTIVSGLQLYVNNKEGGKSHGKTRGKTRRKTRGKTRRKSHGKTRGKTRRKSHGKTRGKTRGKSRGKSRGKTREKTR